VAHEASSLGAPPRTVKKDQEIMCVQGMALRTLFFTLRRIFI